MLRSSAAAGCSKKRAPFLLKETALVYLAIAGLTLPGGLFLNGVQIAADIIGVQ